MQARPLNSTRHTRRALSFGGVTFAGISLALSAPLGSFGAPGESGEVGREAIAGFTAPYRCAILSSELPGRITYVPAEEGQTVAAGELLVQFADDLQKKRAERACLQAESSLEIQLAEVAHRRARQEWDRLTELGRGSLAAAKEIDDAQSEVDASRLRLAVKLMEREQAQLEYHVEQINLERMRILAPFGGCVAERLKQVGETVDEGEPVLRLVQLDPLQVTMDCPVGLIGRLKLGDELTVRPSDPQWPARVGRLSFIDPTADAASQTATLKLVVDNPDRAWLAGLKVWVNVIPSEK